MYDVGMPKKAFLSNFCKKAKYFIYLTKYLHNKYEVYLRTYLQTCKIFPVFAKGICFETVILLDT